ncbi:uncharacterized protein LOC125944474 isoform X2 [Dermacentor silvarum]|uniref:uncharacterized protein LOC125944474 isoform X2 n=1 Tax=Dermacentor silvarum TaxID=543639 RepID=UPI00210075B4|nr:uncharacterized protein LOC125944474 isoform X2 [Dermacentor silvarum]
MIPQWKFIFAAFFAFVLLPLSISGSTEIPYNNPALGIYQNEAACFPIHEKWYIMYRNYQEDPYFGDSGKCITIIMTSPFENNYGTFEVDVGDYVKVSVTATLMSSPGYTVKNVIHVDPTDVPGISFNITSVYTDCGNCKVVLHSYIDGGCSLWQPESTLGQDVKCCQFIYDLVCGPKYPLCEEV